MPRAHRAAIFLPPAGTIQVRTVEKNEIIDHANADWVILIVAHFCLPCNHRLQ